MKQIKFLFIFGCLLLAACHSETENSSKKGKLRVLTTFLPIQSHATAIAGNLADVTQLLTADTGPHEFQLTPADVMRLSQADIFIINGGGLEDWLDELTSKAARPGLVIVDLSEGLAMSENPTPFAETGKIEVGINPHTWLDPLMAKQHTDTILAAMQKADPANAAAYATNAAAYAEQLDALDAEFRTTLAPLANKNLVTFHDAFPYLASRYGLNYIGYISEFPEKDPTPQQLAALVDAIRTANVGVLFAESSYSPKLLLEIARQTEARVSQLDTMEVGIGNSTAYLERMRNNLAALKEAFKP